MRYVSAILKHHSNLGMDRTEKALSDAISAISLDGLATREFPAVALQWQVSPFSGNESSLVPILMKYGPGESGRNSDLPIHRQLAIKDMANSIAMPLKQALSLRRQLIENLVFTNRSRNFYNLNIGSQEDQLEHSKRFEDIASAFLKKQGCRHLTDEDQRKLEATPRMSLDGPALEERLNTWVPEEKEKTGPAKRYTGLCCGCEGPSPFSLRFRPTLERLPFCQMCKARPIQVSKSTKFFPGYYPDILFLHDVHINGRIIRWIECKAYYASALLQTDRVYRKLPVNKIQTQLDRFTKLYGPGAILFSGGFHSNINISDVLILDATPLDMSEMEALSNAIL